MAVLIAPVGAIGREIFSVYEKTLMILLIVSDSIYLQVLSRNIYILQSDSTGLIISSDQEISTFEYLMTGYPKPRSERDIL